MNGTSPRVSGAEPSTRHDRSPSDPYRARCAPTDQRPGQLSLFDDKDYRAESPEPWPFDISATPAPRSPTTCTARS
jgi:hypothetical protein